MSVNTDTWADLYLDWFNNFLSIERFSEYYGLPEDLAMQILKYGKERHEERSQND